MEFPYEIGRLHQSMKMPGQLNFFLGRFPTHMAGITILLVLSGLLEALSLLTFVPVVDSLVGRDVTEAGIISQKIASVIRSVGLPVTLTTMLGAALVAMSLTASVSVIGMYFIVRTKYVVVNHLMVDSFEQFFSARWEFFSGTSQGMILNTFIQEIGAVGEAFRRIASIFASTLRIMFYLIILFVLSWQVTLVAIAATILLSSPFMLVTKISYRLGSKNTSSANDLVSVLHENLGMAKVVMGLGNHHKGLEDLRSSFDAHRRVTIIFQTLAYALPFTYRPLGFVIVAITLVIAPKFGVPLSETAVMVMALFQLMTLVSGLIAGRSALAHSAPSFEQLQSLHKEALRLKQRTGSKKFDGFEREITLEQVSFSYPGLEPTLTDINLRIQKGKMVAIVGESGVGKTTLVDLIIGLHEPNSGNIAFDGTPLQEFDIWSYRQRIGYVPQDSVLFNLSVKDNLLWASENATEEAIRRACQLANADEFISQLPNGYDTMVGDRGVRLSGGQVQRLALARAILREPPLLILDEATSSLDSQSENLIQNAINQIAKKTTVIVIAHRLSTIMNADKVVVLQEGNIVEQGVYQTLVDQGGYFSQMVKLQSLEVAV